MISGKDHVCMLCTISQSIILFVSCSTLHPRGGFGPPDAGTKRCPLSAFQLLGKCVTYPVVFLFGRVQIFFCEGLKSFADACVQRTTFAFGCGPVRCASATFLLYSNTIYKFSMFVHWHANL